MLFAIMIICLVLLMLFRYRLSFPLFVRLEPTSPTHNLATMKSNSCTYKSKKKVSYNSNNKDSSSLRNIGSDRMFLCSQLTASNHDKLNNQNDSFSESYRNSWNMNSPKSSSYKHTVQLDNADKTALLHESQTQGYC
uniref:Uncharacterized protein n=1 Tax=Arion vulgaris TaxID=1028688 RepID=A0A0B6ZY66_9EUPU